MYDIQAIDMEFEQCSPNKTRHNLIIPYAVMHFVLSGEGYVNDNKITENTVFINCKGTHMDYYPSKDNPWSYIYIRLSGSEMKEVFCDYDFQTGLTVLSFDKREELFQILSLYKSFCTYDNHDSRKTIANAILLLFDKKRSATDAVIGTQKQNAEKIKKIIDENYYKKITVKSISEKLFLSKGYIRNLFDIFYGIPPKQYIQNIRMENAIKLLAETDATISVIAKSVGYDDPLLFSKIFKKYYSVSPKNYRKNLKEK